MPANDLVIQERQQAGGAVATAQTEDGFDTGVREHRHEVGGAGAIIPCQKTQPHSNVARKPGFEAQLFQGRNRTINGLRIRRRTGRREDAHHVAETQAFWFDGTNSTHESVIMVCTPECEGESSGQKDLCAAGSMSALPGQLELRKASASLAGGCLGGNNLRAPLITRSNCIAGPGSVLLVWM